MVAMINRQALDTELIVIKSEVFINLFVTYFSMYYYELVKKEYKNP